MSNDSSPLVSVIIPMYNEEDHIQTTINSLLAQTYPNFELILVDDGSTDGTIIKARSFIDDEQHTILRNETNMGQTFSMNRGAMHADGEFLVFHDADDISLPVRFEKQVEFLETNPGIGVVGGAFYYITPNQETPELRVRPSSDGDIRKNMGRGPMINGGTAMYRREALFGADLFQSENVEGYELIIKIGINWELANLSDPVYVYRINDGSRSQHNELVKKATLAYRSWQAIKAFKLPYRYLLLQFGWLIYMNVPVKIQRRLRSAFSPTTQCEATKEDCRKIRELIDSYAK
ncbi:glycosyltransferase family 2 protein [Natronosalvus caseinilyticus]|uniref:glycosyltransferase family 2 protein n=1 Tax=Natronosalvus caseinilyticus TaxID=2953747 RepID=UPI0028A699A7|nr:glycosyltransferase family 2 protein [Natronosalvus caseinilyticus]